ERLMIEIPPLRERAEDIPLLVHHFLNDANPNLPNIFFDAPSMKYLMELPWKGNIRELKNEMERVRLLYSDKKILTVEELSKKYKEASTGIRANADIEPPPQKEKSVDKKSSRGLNSKFRRIEELKKL